MRQLNHPKIDDAVPEYVLNVEPDESNSKRSIKLSELKGNVIVLYWYSKCKYQPEVPGILGKLAHIYTNDVQVYIIYNDQEKIVRQIKSKYPELKICVGPTQHNEELFCHSSSNHAVILNRAGEIVTYGNNIPFEFIVTRLVKGEEFLGSELNFLKLFPREHKMNAYVKIYDSFFEFEKCSFTDTIKGSVLKNNGYSLNCANVTGNQVYHIVTSIDPVKFHFEKFDSTLLNHRYNFCYGINQLKYSDRQGDYDLELANQKFKETAKNKLDSIFGVNSFIQIKEKDTVLIIRNKVPTNKTS